MYDLWWFYFVPQVRRASLAAFFGFLAACAIFLTSKNFYDVALLAIGGAFGISWPAIVMAPMMNFQWMATLPLSRVQLMYTRSFIVASGMIVMTIFYAISQLTFSLIMPRPQISTKSAEAAAKILAGIEVESPGYSLTRVLGDDPVYMLALAITLLYFAFLLLSCSSVVVGASNKTPRQSGSPWWHPVMRIRMAYWAALIGVPLVLLAVSPFTGARALAAINFALLIGYLVFALGHMVMLHARVPRHGARQFFLWVGAGNACLVGLAIAVSWFLG